MLSFPFLIVISLLFSTFRVFYGKAFWYFCHWLIQYHIKYWTTNICLAVHFTWCYCHFLTLASTSRWKGGGGGVSLVEVYFCNRYLVWYLTFALVKLNALKFINTYNFCLIFNHIWKIHRWMKTLDLLDSNFRIWISDLEYSNFGSLIFGLVFLNSNLLARIFEFEASDSSSRIHIFELEFFKLCFSISKLNLESSIWKYRFYLLYIEYLRLINYEPHLMMSHQFAGKKTGKCLIKLLNICIFIRISCSKHFRKCK